VKNYVTIQLKKDEIWIKVAEDAEEKEIIEGLKNKIEDLEKLYKNDTTPIKVVGKILKNKEIEEIRKIVKERINVDIDFESPTTLGLHGIKKGFYKEIKSSETKFYKTSLRCGQKVEFEGSIAILGDVNAGAEVIAEENIIVLGELRGLAHAGAKGNREAIIAANKIDCPQIRIADKIKEFEKEELEETKKYIYINEKDEIVLN
jgi:septum site-determining protein minC